MFKKTAFITALITGITVSTAVNAQEVSLEQFLSAMVSQAAQATKQELHVGVQKAVLTVNNMIGSEPATEYATKVTITDLEQAEVQEDEAE